MICHECGKEFYFGNRPDGLPNGVAMEGPNGETVNICSDCIIAKGKKAREEREKHAARVYAILISTQNDPDTVMSEPVAKAIFTNGGAAVMQGYNTMKYMACIVFKTKLKRDRCASRLEQMNIIHDTRDDAYVDFQYYDKM